MTTQKEIELEQEMMAKEIEEIENYNPPKPKEPSTSEAFIAFLKVFGGVLCIAGLSFALAFAVELFVYITAIVIVLGTIFAIFCGWSVYSGQRDDCEKWAMETCQRHKSAEIAKVKRKYKTRIGNLKKYGSIKSPYFDDVKVCLRCGSTNIRHKKSGSIPGLQTKTIECNDCKWVEFY